MIDGTAIAKSSGASKDQGQRRFRIGIEFAPRIGQVRHPAGQQQAQHQIVEGGHRGGRLSPSQGAAVFLQGVIPPIV